MLARPLGSIVLCVSAALLGAGGCQRPSTNGGAVDLLQAPPFAQPQRVTITGWTESAMEPCLSRDGAYVLFNNSNDPSVDTNLHYAERVDDLTFTYRGPLTAANSSALDGVAALTDDNTLYFISTRSYDPNRTTIFRGRFVGGSVDGVGVVAGVAASAPGRVVFDVTVTADGAQLAYAEGVFTGGSVPSSATLRLATKSGNDFVPSADSVTIFGSVNALGGLVYAPTFSASTLELFFTHTAGSDAPQIYQALRSAPTEPFGTPMRVTAAEGIVEAPTLTPDEKSLYYHRRDGNVFVIYRVTRP